MQRIGLLFALLTRFPLFADGAPSPMRDTGLIQTMVMIVIGMVFFYFILYRPEQKKRQEVEQARDAMKKGDCVVALNIVAHVHKVEEETVVLKNVDGSKVRVLKVAITEVRGESEFKSEA